MSARTCRTCFYWSALAETGLCGVWRIDTSPRVPYIPPAWATLRLPNNDPGTSFITPGTFGCNKYEERPWP